MINCQQLQVIGDHLGAFICRSIGTRTCLCERRLLLLATQISCSLSPNLLLRSRSNRCPSSSQHEPCSATMQSPLHTACTLAPSPTTQSASLVALKSSTLENSLSRCICFPCQISSTLPPQHQQHLIGQCLWSHQPPRRVAKSHQVRQQQAGTVHCHNVQNPCCPTLPMDSLAFGMSANCKVCACCALCLMQAVASHQQLLVGLLQPPAPCSWGNLLWILLILLYSRVAGRKYQWCSGQRAIKAGQQQPAWTSVSAISQTTCRASRMSLEERAVCQVTHEAGYSKQQSVFACCA